MACHQVIHLLASAIVLIVFLSPKNQAQTISAPADATSSLAPSDAVTTLDESSIGATGTSTIKGSSGTIGTTILEWSGSTGTGTTTSPPAFTGDATGTVDTVTMASSSGTGTTVSASSGISGTTTSTLSELSSGTAGATTLNSIEKSTTAPSNCKCASGPSPGHELPVHERQFYPAVVGLAVACSVLAVLLIATIATLIIVRRNSAQRLSTYRGNKRGRYGIENFNMGSP